MTFFLLQHSFIQEAKSVSILNNMIQEALNIMEEESAREENEVRYNLIPRVISPLAPALPRPISPYPVLVVNPSKPLLKLVSSETSQEDKVRCDLIPRVISPLFHVPPTPFCPCS